MQSLISHLGNGFYNSRCSFKITYGLVDIGSHMSLIRLSTGKFLVIDTIPLTSPLKAEIDTLTENGTKIEAILATHPFHTLAFPSFFKEYPNVPYYGTPRHLRKFSTFKWEGDLDDCKVRSKWEPEVQMRIPSGTEFRNPIPEDTNHCSSVFVFHPASRTIHVDDTILYSNNPGFLLRLGGYKQGTMCFHSSLKGVGFLPTPEAPWQFRDWVQGILKDWDFDNMATAHMGVRMGGAKKQLEEILVQAEPLFKKISDKNSKKGSANVSAETEKEEEGEVQQMTVSGSECG